MKRAALVPALLAAASLAGCGSTGAPSTPQTAPGGRVGPMSIGVTGGRLGGAITDTSGGREQELSKAREIDPRVLRQAPNLNEGVAGATDCANADLQPDTTNLPTISDATFCLLNAERAARGLSALKPDRQLQRAALAHGGDMVDHQYFAHEGLDGSEPAERIRATGYLSGGGAWRIGENLAWGTGDFATPRSIMAAWMHSPGHRANILQRDYRQIGFGVIAGNPSPLSLEGRSSFSQRDTRCGSVERMISSKPWRLTASWIASSGSGAPTIPVTSEPAASSSSGSASSSVFCASVSAWSSGSAKRSMPLDVLGTRSVNRAGPRSARSFTAAISAGVAAVRLATTRTRAGCSEDSMRNSL
jgi:uncharacterized protein YkwD